MLTVFFNSVSAVAVIVILTAAGYLCSALGWMTHEAKSFLSKYIMRFAVPVMCVYSLRTNLTRGLLQGSWKLLLIPLITSIVLYLSAGVAGSRLRLDPRSNSVFKTMCSVSNAMFIGYSMCMELFGEACIPYVMTYYLINTSFSQIFCVGGIRRAAGREGRSVRGLLISFFTTPSIVGVLIGILLIVADWTPPALLMTCARYINNTVTPLALLTAGNVIWEIGLKNLRIDRTIALTLGFRFLLAPGICLLLCMLFGVTGLARSVLVVQTAMPVLTQAVVAASEYGGDEQMAAQGVAISTLACFVVIPVLMLLL